MPSPAGRGNLFVVAGPHIGWHDGRWGVVIRPGQTVATAACGALTAAARAAAPDERSPLDPLDAQQALVTRVVAPFVRASTETDETAVLIAATRGLLQRVDADLERLVTDGMTAFDGTVACITGVTINTATTNYLCPSRCAIHRRDTPPGVIDVR